MMTKIKIPLSLTLSMPSHSFEFQKSPCSLTFLSNNQISLFFYFVSFRFRLHLKLLQTLFLQTWLRLFSTVLLVLQKTLLRRPKIKTFIESGKVFTVRSFLWLAIYDILTSIILIWANEFC